MYLTKNKNIADKIMLQYNIITCINNITLFLVAPFNEIP